MKSDAARRLLWLAPILLLIPSPAWSDWSEHTDRADSAIGVAEYDLAARELRLALNNLRQSSAPEADSVIGQVLLRQGDAFKEGSAIDSADYYYQAAIDHAVELYGDSSGMLVRPVAGLARVRMLQHRGDDAWALYDRALTIQRTTPDSLGEQMAVLLYSQAHVYRRQARQEVAADLYQESIDIFVRLEDTLNPRLGQAYNGLAITHKNNGRYAEAEKFYLAALHIWVLRYGEDDPRTATAFRNLGTLYRRMGRYLEAEAHLKRALEIRRSAYGEYHEKVAGDLNSLALLCYRVGRYEDALTYQERCLAVTLEVFGDSTAAAADAHNRLGRMYRLLGHYERAELQFLLAIEATEREVRQGRRVLHVPRTNLARLYTQLGRYDEAERLLRATLEYLERVIPERPQYRIYSLTGLADIALREGLLETAESLTLQVLDLYGHEARVGRYDVTAAYLRLYEIYAAQQQWPRADSVLQLAALANEICCDGDPTYRATILFDRARMAQAQGQHDVTLQLLAENRDLITTYFGPRHPFMALNLRREGHAYVLRGEFESALPRLHQAVRETRRLFGETVDVLPEMDALRFAEGHRRAVYTFLAAVIEAGSSGRDWHETAIEELLTSKGLVTDQILRRVSTTRSGADSVATVRAEELRQARFFLSRAFVEAQTEVSEAPGREYTDSLLERIETLEVDLARRTHSQAEIPTVIATVIPDRVRAALHGSAALVDLLQIENPFEAGDRARYVAAVISTEGPAAWVDLGPADTIDRLIEELNTHTVGLASLGVPATQNDVATYREIGQALGHLIWDPLEPHLPEAGAILVAPDAALSEVAFGALPRENESYLIEDRGIHYVPSARMLLARTEHLPTGSGLLTLADPEFSASESQRLSALNTPDSIRAREPFSESSFALRGGCGSLADVTLASLPHTRREAAQIEEWWSSTARSEVRSLFGAAASEEAFKRYAPGCEVIHLATHGFSLGASCGHAAKPWSAADLGSSFAAQPLLYSGLCLAGATAPADPGASGHTEDGFLTAQEIVDLNLVETDLVVLSGCETGLGQTRRAEGVYGLRRAFLTAGARHIISSLWSVSDVETADMMTGLYEDVDAPVAERLRDVQIRRLRQLRAQGKPTHPVSWAAWIAVGVD